MTFTTIPPLHTIEPVLVLGYTSRRAVRTIVHDILDRADPDVSMAPAGSRAGRLELLFADELEAETAELVLAQPAVWEFADADRSTVGMAFVVAGGELERELVDETRNHWIVRVPFREVSP